MIITEKESRVVELIDIKKRNINHVCKELNISKNECKKILKTVREKIAKGIINGEDFEIEKIEIIEEKLNDICKFRCSICGTIYSINYKEERIVCPMCFSSKVMNKKYSNIN